MSVPVARAGQSVSASARAGRFVFLGRRVGRRRRVCPWIPAVGGIESLQDIGAGHGEALFQSPNAIDVRVCPLKLGVQGSAGTAVRLDRIVCRSRDPVRRFPQEPKAFRRPRFALEPPVEVGAKLGDLRSGPLDKRDIKDGGTRPSGGV
jgi:hypothetical protein